MKEQLCYQQSHLDKVMTTEQFNQIVDAILAGKYSWACVLILRFAGYNPLHYIPYRTYNRLIKEHRHKVKNSSSSVKEKISAKSQTNRKNLGKITDLNYMDVMGEKTRSVRGGYQGQNFASEKDYFDSVELCL